MTTETRDKLASAREQAQGQLQGIREMVERVTHCQDCTGEDCERLPRTILDGLGYGFDNREPTADEIDAYHDEDKARQAIQEDALSVEVRSGWHGQGEAGEDEEYTILLCTGGPAVRIIGNLGEYDEPATARLECQDWFAPWTDEPLTRHEEGALIDYAREFLGG
jgi:hypothetical protein